MNTENGFKNDLKRNTQEQWEDVFSNIQEKNKAKLIEAIYDCGLIYSFDWVKYQEVMELDKDYQNKDLEYLVKTLTLHVRKDRFYEGWFNEKLNDNTIYQLINTIKSKL